MWFLLAAILSPIIFVISLLLGSKVDGAKPKAFEDFTFPRSKEGDPVPRVYGTVIVKGPNTIYAGNFGTVKRSGNTLAYKYYLTVALCVCLGPDVKFRKMWLGKDLVWTGCLTGSMNTSFIQLDKLYGGKNEGGGIHGHVFFFNGDYDQPQSTVLARLLGPNVSAYRGYAMAVFDNGRDSSSGWGFWWGQSPSIQSPSFEVSHHSNSLEIGDCMHIMPNGYDANAIEVLYDLIVNKWANLGIDPAYIDTENWREVGRTTWAEGNGVSVQLSNPSTGGTVAKEIMAQLNAMLYQDPSTGLIKIKLIRNDYVVSDLPVLGPSEISEVRNWSRVLWSQTLNKVRVKYKNRANQYNDGIAPQEDFANIRYQGKIRSGNIDMPLCYDSTLAATLAARELSNVAIPLLKVDLVINREAAALIPGGAFNLVWPEYGVASMVMRARKIGLGRREEGKVTISAVQDEFSSPLLTTVVPPVTDSPTEDFPALDITAFTLWELPYWLTVKIAGDLPGYYRLASLVGAPSAASVDYSAYIDTGGLPEDDDQVLAAASYNSSAQLNADLAQYAGWAAGFVPVLTIKSVTDVAILADGSTATVRAGSGMFLLNGELLAYETFTDNGDGTFDLETVHRSLLDTGYQAGAADDVLWFLDDVEGLFTTEVLPVAQSVYFIDHTFTDYLSESLATRHAITPAGRKDLPVPPDGVTVEGVRALAQVMLVDTAYTIAWLERSRDASLVAIELDATQTPLAGTLYKLEVWSGGVLVFTADDIAGSTYEYTPDEDDEGVAELRVYSKLAGAYSYSYAYYPITIIGDSLAIDGVFVYIDTETVETS
jgi:hypothetical protein